MATVVEAEGLAELGLWDDAWAVLEAVPAADRADPQALRVRLACCPSLDAWEIGRHVADLLRDGGERDREAAAKFFHAVAIKWVQEGDLYAAKLAINEAVSAWPDHRLVVIDDPLLSSALL